MEPLNREMRKENSNKTWSEDARIDIFHRISIKREDALYKS